MGSTMEIFKNILPSYIHQKLGFEQIGKTELPEYTEIDNSVFKQGGIFNAFMDFDLEFKTTAQLVYQYEKFAQIDFVADAIDEIVDESIIQEGNRPVVELNLDNLPLSDDLKEKIMEEFNYLKTILKFDSKADEYFRRWYTCGRLYLQPLFSQSEKDGIVGFHFVKPYNIIRLYDKETNKFYFYINEKEDLFDPNYRKLFSSNFEDLPKEYLVSSDHIIFVPSGITDEKNKVYLSYLHRAIKPANQLKLLEDSIVVYRFTRAPERRAFYIDVGRLSTSKAEQYVKNLMNQFKTKLTYDNSTGVINQDKSIMTMLEDYWLPRMGSKGTEIQTISGSNALSEIDDLLYFKKRVWKSLKIPSTRADDNNTPLVSFGSTEFSREEMKFARFCSKLRSKFSEILTQSLKIHLVKKKILSIQDWYDIFEDRIYYKWNENSYWSESKQLTLLERRIDILDKLENYRGKHFSDAYIEKYILNRTDEETNMIKEEIKFEASETNNELNNSEDSFGEPEFGNPDNDNELEDDFEFKDNENSNKEKPNLKYVFKDKPVKRKYVFGQDKNGDLILPDDIDDKLSKGAFGIK